MNEPTITQTVLFGDLVAIGAQQVVRSVRRIVLHFPRCHPDATAWTYLARALGAMSA